MYYYYLTGYTILSIYVYNPQTDDGYIIPLAHLEDNGLEINKRIQPLVDISSLILTIYGQVLKQPHIDLLFNYT